VYARLPPAATATCHQRFAKLFRGATYRFHAGQWTVVFAGQPLRIPLRPRTAWLDWDAAMSVLGHEVEIKQTYAALLRSRERPDLFVDVGASYGLHSLLFLAHGIDTLSFEPNPECNRYFRELCRFNGLAPTLFPVALGDHQASAELWFPETETWLGSIRKERFPPGTDLVHCPIAVDTLDDHLAGRRHPSRLLIKLDAEGSEAAILRGASRTLSEHRPIIIFESFRDVGRAEIHELLSRSDYRIGRLPWAPGRPEPIETRQEFLEDADSNFLAMPVERAG
jgi:FkbM family methyltransferase